MSFGEWALLNAIFYLGRWAGSDDIAKSLFLFVFNMVLYWLAGWAIRFLKWQPLRVHVKRGQP